MAITNLTNYLWIGNDTLDLVTFGSLRNILYRYRGSDKIYDWMNWGRNSYGDWESYLEYHEQGVIDFVYITAYFDNEWRSEDYRYVYFIGGEDVTDTALIEWLSNNGSLIKQITEPEFITDRTVGDMQEFATIIEKMKSRTATAEERAMYFNNEFKATYDYTDMNRLAFDLLTIQELSAIKGVTITYPITPHAEWKQSDLYLADFIHDDVQAVASAWGITTPIPTGNMTYQKANIYEQILLDVYNIVTEVDYLYTGFDFITDGTDLLII